MLSQDVDLISCRITATKENLAAGQKCFFDHVERLRKITTVHYVSDACVEIDKDESLEVIMFDVRRCYSWHPEVPFNEEDWGYYEYFVICDAVDDRCDEDTWSSRFLWDLELDITEMPPLFWSWVTVVSLSPNGLRFPIGTADESHAGSKCNPYQR